MFLPFILASTQQLNPFYAISPLWLNSFFYPISFFKENWLFLFIIPAIIFFFKSKEYRKKEVGVIFYAFTVFLIYFTLIPNKQLRFALSFLPFASALAAYGFYHTFSRLYEHKKLHMFWRLAVLLMVIFTVFFLFNDGRYGLILSKYEKSEITDFYGYFIKNQSDAVIFTTIPFPMVYSDNKFIPMYYVNEEFYSRLVGEAGVFVYASYALPCLPQDAVFLKRKSDFYLQLQKDFPKKAVSKFFFGEEYAIFFR
ncbi:hypothetical protein HY643_04140 [Candidatus Woesearchaeota archaeon]|nr:hypothetical protein [Candidatus Woesearchaeota archaeon]